MLEYQLFFGRGGVTDKDWTDFAAQVVTRQPARRLHRVRRRRAVAESGHEAGRRERSKVIVVAVPDTPVTRIGHRTDQGRIPRAVPSDIGGHHHPPRVRRVLTLRRQFVADRGLDLDRPLHRRPRHHPL